jgi:GNAT superfamily N-acetyltransferase
MMQLHIVRATRDHLPLLIPLFDAYRRFYCQCSDVEGSRKFLSDRLEQRQSVIFLAQRDGDACGFTQLFPAFSSVAMRPTWILNDLFVTPESRRLGVGQSLLRTATEFAAETGGKRLVLATAVDNLTAQSLYEQLGWRKDDGFIHYIYEL